MHCYLFFLALLVFQLSASASSVTLPSTARDGNLADVPLFRAPEQHEASPHTILWSAHETGDSRQMLPVEGVIWLACLLDRKNNNSSVPVHSLAWVIVDEATTQETRHRLSGSGRTISFVAGGVSLAGHYSEWRGSTLNASVHSSLQMHVKIRCEYQLDGLTSAISSSWLYLWDERSEMKRLQEATLTCNRTVYKRQGAVSLLPLAVSYNCLGIGDTRLLETAVLSVCACSAVSKVEKRVEKTQLSTNSSTSGRDFFGFAFAGRIGFGWTVDPYQWGHDSSSPGLGIEQKLIEPGDRLKLTLSTTLPSGRLFTLIFLLPTISTSNFVTVSREDLAIIPGINDGSLPTEVQLDELFDPAERALPCPLLCLSAKENSCQHRWTGSSPSLASTTSLASQPQSQRLSIANPQSVGTWTCSLHAHNISITYVVSVRPRPFVCKPRFPNRSVAFPPDHLTINCSLCGVTTDTKIEFDIFASQGFASYNMERSANREKGSSASVGLSFSEFSPNNYGATFVLRCRAVDLRDGRAGLDYAILHLLPVPVVKPLDVCLPSNNPCQLDCRSPMESMLRSFGISVSYLFSLYSSTDKLYTIVHERSGLLRNAWSAIKGKRPVGSLRPQCQQLFYYKDERVGYSSRQTFSLDSKPDKELYRSELGEKRFSNLIFVAKEGKQKLAPTGMPSNMMEDENHKSRLFFALAILTSFIAPVLLLCACKMFASKKKNKNEGNKNVSPVSPMRPQDMESRNPSPQIGMGTTRSYNPAMPSANTNSPPQQGWRQLPQLFQQPQPQYPQQPQPQYPQQPQPQYPQQPQPQYPQQPQPQYPQQPQPQNLQQPQPQNSPQPQPQNPPQPQPQNPPQPQPQNPPQPQPQNPPQPKPQNMQKPQSLSLKQTESQKQHQQETQDVQQSEASDLESNQTVNQNAVQSGFQADMDISSSTRSRQFRANFPGEAHSSPKLDTASTDSEAQTPDVDLGDSKLPSLKVHSDDAVGQPTSKMFNQHSFAKVAERLLAEGRSRSTGELTDHSTASPDSKVHSQASSTAIGFDFCLQNQESEQDAHNKST